MIDDIKPLKKQEDAKQAPVQAAMDDQQTTVLHQPSKGMTENRQTDGITSHDRQVIIIVIIAYLKTNAVSTYARTSGNAISNSSVPKATRITTSATVQEINTATQSINQLLQTIGNGQDFSANNDLSNSSLGL